MHGHYHLPGFETLPLDPSHVDVDRSDRVGVGGAEVRRTVPSFCDKDLELSLIGAEQDREVGADVLLKDFGEPKAVELGGQERKTVLGALVPRAEGFVHMLQHGAEELGDFF